MLQDILFGAWFMLPAAVANAAPVFSAAAPLLKPFDAPLDGGATFRGKRLFGEHKTWRGLISGIVAATLVLWLQQYLVAHIDWAQAAAQQVDYAALSVLLVGPIFAIGALGGDAIKSFFKRQCNIESGKSWFPFDQIDYIIGTILVSLTFVVLTPMQYVGMCLFWFVGHLIASYIGYLLGLKKDPI